MYQLLAKLILDTLSEAEQNLPADQVSFKQMITLLKGISSKLVKKGVIVLPHKIGDIIYVISNRRPWIDNAKEIIECEVVKLHIKNDSRTVIFSCRSTDSKVSYQGNFNANSLGKTVFNTYKEAEEYLKKKTTGH